jgi:lipid-A-disaccharide synthase
LTAEVLVVAGEASGDRIAALVAAELGREGVRCAGIGGPACRAAGVQTFADASALAAMGVGDVAARLPALVGALGLVARHLRREPPRAALLVNFTEANQRLGRMLRTRGTRVLWCAAPQVWAWRPRRLEALRGAADRMAVLLPFEEPLWRAAGHDAVYVGHPAVDLAGSPSSPRPSTSLAVLPGSRAAEAARLAAPFTEAAACLLDMGAVTAARVVLASSLPPHARARVERLARGRGLSVVEAEATRGAGPLLSGHAVSLCASGTASLEAALAGAAPVVAYRLDPLAFLLARRLVRTPHIALPNVLLGRRAFPELIQDEVTPARLVAAARELLARGEAVRDELSAILVPPSPAPFGRRVADLLLPWLAA